MYREGRIQPRPRLHKGDALHLYRVTDADSTWLADPVDLLRAYDRLIPGAAVASAGARRLGVGDAFYLYAESPEAAVRAARALNNHFNQGGHAELVEEAEPIRRSDPALKIYNPPLWWRLSAPIGLIALPFWVISPILFLIGAAGPKHWLIGLALALFLPTTLVRRMRKAWKRDAIERWRKRADSGAVHESRPLFPGDPRQRGRRTGVPVFFKP